MLKKKNRKLDSDSDIVMYIIVNAQLNMSKGKIASQVAHSACSVVMYLTKNPTSIFREWNKCGSAKIILRSIEQDMWEVIHRYNNIYD